MEGPDNRARWMRNRGVEIYTPATLNLLEDFKTSEMYEVAVAHAVHINTLDYFSQFMRYLPNALPSAILDYLEQQGFDALLGDINAHDKEIKSYTAAVNKDPYKKPAKKRSTTQAAIHFVDSLMFGLRFPIALASDAYLCKQGLRDYTDVPTEPPLTEIVNIMRNESFVHCLNNDFAKTGFGVLRDDFTSTHGSTLNAGAAERHSELGVTHLRSLFLYDQETDTFGVHPEVEQALKDAYRIQNLGQDSRLRDSILKVGHFGADEKALTVGCPLRHEWNGGATSVVGIEETAKFVADFCQDVLNEYRHTRSSRIPTSQQVQLARTALKTNAQSSRLLNFSL